MENRIDLISLSLLFAGAIVMVAYDEVSMIRDFGVTEVLMKNYSLNL